MDVNVGGWFGEWMGEPKTDWWMYRIIHIARHSVGGWGVRIWLSYVEDCQ